MKLLTGTPARRLMVASTSAVVFHAAVFGAIEWNLSQTESQPAEESALLSVAVTMQEASQPEIPNTSSEPVEMDDTAKPSNSGENRFPDKIAAAEAAAAAADEIAAESLTLRDSESAKAADAAPAPAPDPEASGDTDADAEAPRSDTQDSNTERETATTATPPRPSEDEMVPAALQRSVDAYRRAAPIPPPPTLEPVRYTPPRYPETARRRGLTGTVVVEATIGHRGRVDAVRVLNSSGVDSLDTAATRAVHTWRFSRDTKDQTSIHRIRFDLEETP